MAPTRVLVIGAGVAGPVVAIFLKQHGYDPVLCERTETLNTAGLSLCLQPNGLTVLSQIPGLVEELKGSPLEHMGFYSVLPAEQCVLAENDGPAQLRAATGLGQMGIKRSALLKNLVDHAQSVGIEVKWGHKLVDVESLEDSVRVKFENGAEETASFVIGCDGLHSNTRIALFGEHQADFTGLTQCGGFSPVPEYLKGKAMMLNIFDEDAHMIAYQVEEDAVSWAITQRGPEAKETWRSMDQAAIDEFKKSSVSSWDYGGGELVKNGTNVTKYGLYDRPSLKTWHKGRVILIGDAAHPTSPHLGQGANQAFEDVDLLIKLLKEHNPSAASPTTDALQNIFNEFESVRLPRSSEMVQGARKMGESRVVHGIEACIARNQSYRDMWKDISVMGTVYGQNLANTNLAAPKA